MSLDTPAEAWPLDAGSAGAGAARAGAVRNRAAALAIELAEAEDGGDAEALRRRLPEVTTTLRAAADALAALELQELMLEAKDEQIARQAEVLEAIGYPVLEVSPDVLCMPIIGPFDLERARRLMDVALGAAVARRAAFMVLDLTGALVEDPMVAGSLSEVVRALSLVGVRVVITGVSPSLAALLAEGAAALACFGIYPTLSSAISAIALHRAALHARSIGPLRRRKVTPP